jgi:hypothetical protein
MFVRMSLSGEWFTSRVRVVAAVSATAAVLALPSGAHAQDLTMCQNLWGSITPGEPNVAFQITSGALKLRMGDEVTDAVKAVVTTQYSILWVNDRRQGWSVAIAPGDLDVDAAKAAIVDRIQASFTAEQAAFLRDHLSVWATPYAEPDLRAIQDDISTRALKPLDQGWGMQASIMCVPGDPAAEAGSRAAADGWRVTATLYTGDVEPSADLLSQAKAAVESYGDKVRLEVKRGDGRLVLISGAAPIAPVTPVTPPPIVGSKPAPLGLRVSRYVSIAHRSCVRGQTVTIKARKPANLRKLTVQTPSRKLTLRPGKSAKVRLAAKGKTTVSVTVVTKGGQTGTQTYTFRRCG